MRNYQVVSEEGRDGGREGLRMLSRMSSLILERISHARYVEPGSTVEEFDVLVEVQSDKASVEITSRYAGIVKEHCYQVGEVAKVGSALCRIQVQSEEEETSEDGQLIADQSGAKDESSSQQVERTSEPAMTGQGDSTKESSLPSIQDSKGSILATPAVRRMIREHGVEISKVKGTGKSGRVTKEDIQSYMTASPEVPSKEGYTKQQGEEIVTKNLTGTRKAMFKAMSATWNIPHFGYSDEIDVTKLDQIRKEMQSKVVGKDTVKLTLLPFLIKALSMTLDQHPIFRSTLEEAAMLLREKEEHRISIALSSSRGLITPTLAQDVRQLSIPDIAEQVQSLQRISMERGLSQKEMGSGATVTLSNIGNIGGLFTFPLIPPTGQLIIGAVGKSRIMPRFDENGTLIKALILPASFSADHRVVEGVELARFVQDWKELLENPTTWLLQLR